MTGDDQGELTAEQIAAFRADLTAELGASDAWRDLVKAAAYAATPTRKDTTP